MENIISAELGSLSTSIFQNQLLSWIVCFEGEQIIFWKHFERIILFVFLFY